MKKFRLPEIGENIEEATVIAVLIEAGGVVGKDEPIIELETDKSVFELPCPFAGTVEKIEVVVGDKIKVGGTIAVINESGKSVSPAKSKPAKKEKPGGEKNSGKRNRSRI